MNIDPEIASYVNLGMLIIRQYDRAMYDNMIRSDWEVQTIDVWNMLTCGCQMGTNPDGTYVNLAGIDADARNAGLEMRWVIAATLVHEWQHWTEIQSGKIGGYDDSPDIERRAFDTEMTFIRKLPPQIRRVLARETADIARTEISHLT